MATEEVILNADSLPYLEFFGNRWPHCNNLHVHVSMRDCEWRGHYCQPPSPQHSYLSYHLVPGGEGNLSN